MPLEQELIPGIPNIIDNGNSKAIFKCPHCYNKIDFFYYNVQVRERGDCGFTRVTRKIQRNGTEEIKSFIDPINHNSNDSDWDEDPNYYCPECDHIIEPNNLQFEYIGKTKEIKKEEKDASECTGNIIITSQFKGKNKTFPINTTEFGICRCPSCNFPAILSSEKYEHIDKNSISLCPNCGEEIEIGKLLEKRRKELKTYQFNQEKDPFPF